MVFIGTTDHLTDNSAVDLWAHKMADPVWNWKPGQIVIVNVFTNCEEVELFLNNRSLGIKKMADFKNRTITWEVPFEAGRLRAVARISGKEMASYELNTTGAPVRIMAKCDVMHIRADRQDLVNIFVTLCDVEGNTVYFAENDITCEVIGPVRILGMEDSNPQNIESYKDNKQHAYHGKLLIYLQSLDKPGKAIITLSSPGLQETNMEIDVSK
jgi:hypothetical protein